MATCSNFLKSFAFLLPLQHKDRRYVRAHQHLCIFYVFDILEFVFWCDVVWALLFVWEIRAPLLVSYAAHRCLIQWLGKGSRASQFPVFSLSLSHSWNQIESLLCRNLSALPFHTFLSPFFYLFFYTSGYLSPVLPSFSSLYFLSGWEKGCITSLSLQTLNSIMNLWLMQLPTFCSR